MTYRAYIDESESEGGYFAIAGLAAPLENWQTFSMEWERALRGGHGTLSDNDTPTQHFHMVEMALNNWRMARVPIFWNIASRHATILFSLVIRLDDLKRARSRVRVRGHVIDWGALANPYIYCFDLFMRMFIKYIEERGEKLLPEEAMLDFIFDENTQKRPILEGWESFMAHQSEETRRRFGAAPRFEDDHVCLPLQAADCFAWFVRRGAERGEDPKSSTPPAPPNAGQGQKWLDMRFDEVWIMHDLARIVRAKLPQGADVIDATTHQDIGVGTVFLRSRPPFVDTTND